MELPIYSIKPKEKNEEIETIKCSLLTNSSKDAIKMS